MSHSRQAPFKLNVIIVGGGKSCISGLSTALGLARAGHTVRILEKDLGLGKPAGGVRLPPNVTKILVNWGLEEDLKRTASLIRQGSNLWDIDMVFVVQTGHLLGYLEWAEDVIQESGAKFYMMRYSDLQEILYNAAVKEGAQVLFNSQVMSISPPSRKSGSDATAPSPGDKPSVQLSDGTVLVADMVIGADGPHSTVRSFVENTPVEPRQTGIVAFSGNLPIGKILEDEILRTEQFAFSWVYWFGSQQFVMGYPIAHDREFALHFFLDRVTPGAPEGWTPNVSAKSLQLSDAALDKRLARVFSKLDAVCWQQYLDWPKIESWSDESRRIVLIGEASRPLIPCSTHGCSVSVESAAVFSTLFSYVRNQDHIPLLVRAYEDIRRDRTEFLHQIEVQNVTQSMFPPGPDRIARDEEMRKSLELGDVKWDDDAYLGLWGEICKIWSYNAFDAAEDWWVKWGVLRECSLSTQNPSIEVAFEHLEVEVSERTDAGSEKAS
ncbi:hypothetical protein BC834DRAFT_1038601 [Gloeopeniophorella convolvens]|nr:hypothetical protein BC834DRAFT_1038601 [Gloeopeniophorella convolvens]